MTVTHVPVLKNLHYVVITLFTVKHSHGARSYGEILVVMEKCS